MAINRRRRLCWRMEPMPMTWLPTAPALSAWRLSMPISNLPPFCSITAPTPSCPTRADPKMPSVLGITPLIAASGLDYWEGEAPGPFTGVTEAERLEAVKLAIELGNDINAAADFGDYKMEGDPEYTLLYYPLNMDQLIGKVLGDPRWSGSTALHGAVVSGQAGIVQFLVDHGAKLDAKTKTGWTPLMMAGGVFYANAKKEYPAAAAILKKAMVEHGLLAATPSR